LQNYPEILPDYTEKGESPVSGKMLSQRVKYILSGRNIGPVKKIRLDFWQDN
jgi:hypothetical protein